MEAFESFVAVALESAGFVVSSAVKFGVKLKTKKAAYEEFQSHGYEVDLIGARADRLVLATVKSFLGSRGVVAEHVTGATTNERWKKLYALLNNDEIAVRSSRAREIATAIRSTKLNCGSTSVASQRQPSEHTRPRFASGRPNNMSAQARSRSSVWEKSWAQFVQRPSASSTGTTQCW